MYDIEANKKLACDLMEALANAEIDRYASMIAEDAIFEVMGTGVMAGSRTKAEIVEAAGGFVQVFPKGVQVTVTGLTAEGDRVAMEARGSGTAISGAQYNNTYHFLFVIRDGKVKECREYLCSNSVDQVLASLS